MNRSVNRSVGVDIGTMNDLEDLDMSVIDNLPWAKQLWEVLQQHTQKGFLNWCKIAEKLAGPSTESVKAWTEEYIKVIDETYYDLVMDLDSLHTRTIDNIQEMLGKWQQLCLELNTKMPPKIGQDKLSLLEEHCRLNKTIKECENLINEKKKEIEKLNEKERKYCEYLGKKPKYNLSYPPLPTQEQLEQYQTYVDELEHEKFEREEQLCIIKEEVVKIANQLKYKPNTDFECNVLTSDNFSVTTENMEKINLFHKSLKDIQKATLEEISYLRTRVEDLWKSLEIDLMDRDEFRSHYTGNSLTVLEALRVEVKRCEEIRKANVKVFVEKDRIELEELWKQCHRTEQEKKQFQYFNSDCYTEDLLDLHEIEIQKWKTYYRENVKLISLLGKHKELWERNVQLEENTIGANRYKNRGGKLLQEEKERNKLAKMIPKIEEEILALAEEYRNNNCGQHFLSFGMTPDLYIKNLYAERENVKQLKLSARKLQRENLTVTPGKSAMALFPSTSTATTPTLLSATKRKILGTPASENKRLRVNTPRPFIKPKGTPLTIPKIKVTYTPMTLPSQKRRSSKGSSKRRRSKRSKGSDSVSKNTTYNDFQNELSNKNEWRSTIMPSEQFTPLAVKTAKAPRTPAILKTPKSTGKGKSTKLSACKTNLGLMF